MDWLTFQITLAIKLSLQVYHEESFVKWANAWLDGSDRSAAAAYADAYADAAAAYAAYAAAYAAYAAAYAADATDAADASIRASLRLGAKLESVVRFID